MAIRLNWPDERYARIYCRDTIDWSALSWDAQALWMQLNRKADRRGIISLGRPGRRGIAALVGRAHMWPEPLEAALAELEADGCVRVEGTDMVIEQFVEAQEAVSSGAARTRKWREGSRARGDEPSPPPSDEPSRPSDEPSPGNETSQKVTPGYGTARKGTEGTAPPSERGPVPRTAASWSAPSAGDETKRVKKPFDDDVREQAASLDAEATRDEARCSRVLEAVDGEWRIIADIAADLGRSARSVETDLVHLGRQGRVEQVEKGTPPVVHWRRAGPAVGAAGGRSAWT